MGGKRKVIGRITEVTFRGGGDIEATATITNEAAWAQRNLILHRPVSVTIGGTATIQELTWRQRFLRWSGYKMIELGCKILRQ